MEYLSTGEHRISSSPKQQLGFRYETLACEYLQAKGLELIARNSQCSLGEIDIIMRDGEFWVFVEVRYRRTDYFGLAQSTIDIRKQRKVILAAMSWLGMQSINIHEVACRFDVFAITGNEQNWIIDAFGQDIMIDR